MAWEPLGALKGTQGNIKDPIVLRQLPGMEALRALKAIPACPKAALGAEP